MEELKDLFQPMVVGGLELRNRIVMAPVATGLSARDGSVSQREIDYYAERAKGGVGLIITGVAIVDHPVGSANTGELVVDKDSYIPALSRLADAVHEHGAKIALQLGHVGRYRFSRISGVQPVAPSAIPSRLPAPEPRALTTEEVEALIEKYADAAARAQQAGFDGVEVQAALGYLASTFLSPLTNRRTDRFGGDSIEARATFLVEIVKRIREKVGKNLILGCKLSVDQFMTGGVTIEDSKVIARMSEEAGVSMFNASPGWHEAPVPTTIASVPRGAFVYLAEALKEAVSVPVGAACRINEPRLADRIIAEKRADLVIMGRPLLADPYLPEKAAEGRLDDIRMCIACNACLDRVFGAAVEGSDSEQPIICSVNAEIGKEGENRTAPAATRKKVLVVGGGPAGMEAARVAALRGHEVSLWEAKDRLGGALLAGAVAPYKQEISNLTAYLSHQVEKLRVKVELNKQVTPEAVVEEKADEVILAIGALPVIPEIPGARSKNVIIATDVLAGINGVGRKIAVIGGGLVGCETAELLASQGKKVTIVEILPHIGRDVGVTNRGPLRERLLRLGVEVLTSAETKKITDTGITLETRGETQTIEVDTVVLAVGFKPDRSLWEALEGRCPRLHLIGDYLEPNRILEAIRDGWSIGCKM